MAIRNIVKEGDPVLNKVCRPVVKFDARLAELIDDMIETNAAANGAGLAAPQVGILRRIAVVDTGIPAFDEEDSIPEQDAQEASAGQTASAGQDDQAAPEEQESPYGDVKDYCEEPLILINPVIVETDGEQKGSEGCLSVPGKAGEGKLEREQESVSLPGIANRIFNPENIPVQSVLPCEYQEAGSLFQKL
jgi:peptide deformylase